MAIGTPSVAHFAKLLRTRSAWVVAALGAGAVLTVVACQEYPFLYRPHQRIATTTVHEIVMRNSDTDILFVIDNSGSMQEEQDNVIRNTRVFIDELAKSDNSYQVGIATTDAIDAGHPGEDGGRLRMVRASQSQLNTAGCTISPDASPQAYWRRPNLDDPDEDAKRCRLVQDFTATVASLGTDGSGTEAGLLGARKALDGSDAAVATRNAGFLRPTADLALIFLSDEEDCSRESYDTNRSNDYCYQKATLDTDITIGNLVNTFAGLKDTGVRKVRAALIAGGVKSGESNADFSPTGCRIANSLPTDDCACWSASNDDFACTYPAGVAHACTTTAGCSTARCEALAPTRYHAFMGELRRQRLNVGFSGGTYEDSICQDEYDKTLLTIARTVVLSNCFDLEAPIDFPDTIRLKIRHTDDQTGAVTDIDVPRLDTDTTNTDAGCHDLSCGNACASGAWQLMDPKTICLQCGLKKGTGDEFLLTAMTEMAGFDGGSP